MLMWQLSSPSRTYCKSCLVQIHSQSGSNHLKLRKGVLESLKIRQDIYKVSEGRNHFQLK